MFTNRNERRAEFLRALSAGDRAWGRVRNIVDYGAFIDLGCRPDGLLHLSGIPGVVNGMDRREAASAGACRKKCGTCRTTIRWQPSIILRTRDASGGHRLQELFFR